jgi:hypothetical protein
VDRGFAVLQALHQRAGGKAERVLVERELHRSAPLYLPPTTVTAVPLRPLSALAISSHTTPSSTRAAAVPAACPIGGEGP